jgi:hypothetical protein
LSITIDTHAVAISPFLDIHPKTDRVPFTMEERYDILRQIFHNEEDARAAVLYLFGGEDYEAQ